MLITESKSFTDDVVLKVKTTISLRCNGEKKDYTGSFIYTMPMIQYGHKLEKHLVKLDRCFKRKFHSLLEKKEIAEEMRDFISQYVNSEDSS